MGVPLPEDDTVAILKDLQKRVKTLEQGNTITSLKLGAAGVLIVPVKTADPGTATNGEIFYNSTTNKFRVYENGAWANMV